MMQVRANLNFGVFRQGKIYMVEKDTQVTALLGVGYLTEVTEDDRDHHGGRLAVSDGVVADSAPFSQDVDDGESEDQPPGKDPGGAEGSGAAGVEDD